MIPTTYLYRGVTQLNPPPDGPGGLLLLNNDRALSERAPKYKDDATVAPVATDDISNGWYPRSVWVMAEAGRVFMCLRNDPNSAVWLELTTSDQILGGLITLDEDHLVLGGELHADGHKITNVGDPVDDNDAANAAWVSGITNTISASLSTHTSRTDNPHSVTAAQVGALATSTRNAANGVAGLGADGKILSSLLPALAITNTSVVDNQSEMLALAAETGDVAIRTDISSTYILKGSDPTNLADWSELSAPGAVTSFNGRSGTILPAEGDYLGSQVTLEGDYGLLGEVANVDALAVASGDALDAHDGRLDTIEASVTALESGTVTPEDLEGYALANHTHVIAGVTGLQTALNAKAPYTHTHTVSDVTGLQSALDGKSDGNHTHTISDTDGLQDAIDDTLTDANAYTDATAATLTTAIEGRAEAEHTHVIGDITNLTSTLASKSNVGHVHDITDVTNLTSTLSGKAPLSHSHAISNVSGLQTALDAKVASSVFDDFTEQTDNPHSVTAVQTGAVPASTVGEADGVCPLDSNGKVPDGFLPPLAIHETSVVASLVAMKALTAQKGDVAVRTDENKTYILSGDDPTVEANWQEIKTPTSAVSSVYGRTGAVIAQAGDYTSQLVTFTSTGDNGTMTVRTAIDNLFDGLADKSDVGHAHAITDVSGLTAALASKSEVGHQHTIAQVTNLQTTLDAKALATHTHEIADVEGLSEELTGKAEASHTHLISQITNLQTTLDAKATVAGLGAHSALTNNPHATTWIQTGGSQSVQIINRAPTADDDLEAGHSQGRTWVNTALGEVWVCVDNTNDAAVWRRTTLNTNPSSFAVPVRISHYESPEAINWHVQIQIAALDDPSFTTSLVSKDSSDNQNNWTYRLDGFANDGSLQVIPEGGVATSLGNAMGEFNRVATAFYRFASGELSSVTRGTTYWLRVRQSADGGDTWSAWTVDPVTVP